ncbi:MAG: hypothetical protein U9M96_02840 [Thermodesulfobacteriota bacterium]|nr:hypothetical protein [Thermodesulfobacteriota bacterium]
MKKILLILIIAGVFAFGALNYHIILMDTSIRVLKKTDLALDNTFVDARGAKKYQLLLKPTLVKAGVKNLFTDESITIGK